MASLARLIAVSFLLSPAWPALASRPACLIHFAATSPSEEGKAALVRLTYEELLDKVGAGRLAAAQIARMTKAQDPFRVPEEKDEDFHELNRRLAQFRDLIKARDWNTKEVHTLLLTILAERTDKAAMAKDSRERALTETESDFRMDIPNFAGSQPHPDGRYLVGIDSGTITLIDLQDRKTTSTQCPRELGERTFFLPDGSAMIFADRGLGRHLVPFKEGQFLWDQTRELMKGDGVTETADPSWTPVTGTNVFLLGYLLKDLFVGEPGKPARRLTLPPVAPASTLWTFAAVPGQNRILLATGGSNEYYLTVVRYVDGKLVAEGPARRVPFPASELRASPDGSQVIATGDHVTNRAIMAPMNGGEFVPLLARNSGETFGSKITGSQLLREKNEIVIFSENDSSTKTFVEVVDLKTRRSHTHVEVPFRLYSPYVTPDMKWLHGRGLNDGVLRVYNFKGRTDE